MSDQGRCLYRTIPGCCCFECVPTFNNIALLGMPSCSVRLPLPELCQFCMRLCIPCCTLFYSHPIPTRPSTCCYAGVAAVLQHCPQLTSLHLLSCTGPFTGILASQPVSATRAPRATAAADAAQAEAEWSRPPAFQVQELIIKFGASALTDRGLAALLHPQMAALRCLVLAGCSHLSDAAWDIVAQHAGTLECLQLDSCGALPTVQKGRAQPCAAAALSAGAAVKALSTCHRLQALTIRNCVSPAVSQAQRNSLCAACTALQTLDMS